MQFYWTLSHNSCLKCNRYLWLMDWLLIQLVWKVLNYLRGRIFGITCLEYPMIWSPKWPKNYSAISFLYKLLKQNPRSVKGKWKRQLPLHQKPQSGIKRPNKEGDRNFTECYNSKGKISPRHLLFNHALSHAICQATRRFLLIAPFIGKERRTS